MDNNGLALPSAALAPSGLSPEAGSQAEQPATNAGHTPGPWVIDPRNYWDKEIGIEQNGDGWHRFRCEVDYDDCDPDTAEANARLIAAAPDLLAMCQHTAKIFREYEKLHREKRTTDGDYKADRNMHSALAIESVIEQATGAA